MDIFTAHIIQRRLEIEYDEFFKVLELLNGDFLFLSKNHYAKTQNNKLKIIF